MLGLPYHLYGLGDVRALNWGVTVLRAQLGVSVIFLAQGLYHFVGCREN